MGKEARLLLKIKRMKVNKAIVVTDYAVFPLKYAFIQLTGLSSTVQVVTEGKCTSFLWRTNLCQGESPASWAWFAATDNNSLKPLGKLSAHFSSDRIWAFGAFGTIKDSLFSDNFFSLCEAFPPLWQVLKHAGKGLASPSSKSKRGAIFSFPFQIFHKKRHHFVCCPEF